MADVKLVKSNYTGSVVTSLGEVASADNARLPGTLQVDGVTTLGSLAGFLFGTAGVVSALSGANRFYIGSTSRDISIASGTQAITGVGFTSAAVLFIMSQDSTAKVSVGFSNLAANYSIANAHGYIANVWVPGADSAIYAVQTGTDTCKGVISSFGADGFTITWTKAGSPTGTISIFYLAIR